MVFIIIGLSLDIIGVILLFVFGIPPTKMFDHVLTDNEHPIEDEKLYRIMSKLGLILLLIGFISQLIGTVLMSI